MVLSQDMDKNNVIDSVCVVVLCLYSELNCFASQVPSVAYVTNILTPSHFSLVKNSQNIGCFFMNIFFSFKKESNI